MEGGRLHGSLAGDGPPVLLLHGGPGLSWDYLQPVVDELADALPRRHLPAARPGAVDGARSLRRGGAGGRCGGGARRAAVGARTRRRALLGRAPAAARARRSSAASEGRADHRHARGRRRRRRGGVRRGDDPPHAARGRRARRATRARGDRGPRQRARPDGVDAAVLADLLREPRGAGAVPGLPLVGGGLLQPRSSRFTASCPGLAERIAGVSGAHGLPARRGQPDARLGVLRHGACDRRRPPASRSSAVRDTSPGWNDLEQSGPRSIASSRGS